MFFLCLGWSDIAVCVWISLAYQFCVTLSLWQWHSSRDTSYYAY